MNLQKKGDAIKDKIILTLVIFLIASTICFGVVINSLRYELSEAELSRDMCHEALNRAGDVRMDNYEVDYFYMVRKQ